MSCFCTGKQIQPALSFSMTPKPLGVTERAQRWVEWVEHSGPIDPSIVREE